MSPENPQFVMVGGFALLLGEHVFIQAHMGCVGSDGKISEIKGAKYYVTCDKCGRKAIIDMPTTLKDLQDNYAQNSGLATDGKKIK